MKYIISTKSLMNNKERQIFILPFNYDLLLPNIFYLYEINDESLFLEKDYEYISASSDSIEDLIDFLINEVKAIYCLTVAEFDEIKNKIESNIDIITEVK